MAEVASYDSLLSSYDHMNEAILDEIYGYIYIVMAYVVMVDVAMSTWMRQFSARSMGTYI